MLHAHQGSQNLLGNIELDRPMVTLFVSCLTVPDAQGKRLPERVVYVLVAGNQTGKSGAERCPALVIACRFRFYGPH